MCWPMVIPLAVMAVGALANSRAARQQSEANKQAYEHQAATEADRARIADIQAKDAISRGQSAQATHRMKVGQLTGQQRARFAAAGLDLDEGSPLNVLMDTEYLGELDARTISDNAEKEAWALREGARTGRSNADFLSYRAASEDPSQAGRLALLSGAGQVASSWYGYGRR